MDDVNVLNFQELIESYETLIKEITEELDVFKIEQDDSKIKITALIDENKQLSSKVTELLNEKLNSTTNLSYKEADFSENLRKQLDLATSEKENVTKLWQNAVETVDYLEEELKFYQSNGYGLVSNNTLTKLKLGYEEKIQNIERNLAETQIKLKETVKLNSKQIELKDIEIHEIRSRQEDSIKFIKKLEDETLKLQKTLQNSLEIKSELEKLNRNKNEEIEKLKIQNNECRRKVEEAVQVVEAALNEKDAALLREKDAKDEVTRLSTTLSELIDETNDKVKKEINLVKTDCNSKLEKARNNLQLANEAITIKSLEIEKYKKDCTILNNEIERLQKGHLHYDESSTSKLLLLEKNLENTFQKLLLSEKQNIQITSEKESIKNDLDQMASFYERDIKARETETVLLKNKIKKMEIEIEENYLKLVQSTENIEVLNKKIESMETEYRHQIEDNKILLEEQHNKKLMESQAINDNMIKEMSEQLELQREINQKWRIETKIITEKLSDRIKELKMQLNRVNSENKVLLAQLQESNGSIEEYKKFLQTVSKNVNKITSGSSMTELQTTK